jgi:catechol 2,3-dioxygenase-like lactoylglutathione lyase family enzyme
VDAAAAAVTRLSGLLPQGPIQVAVAPSPLAGASFARFRTPWGMSFELRSMPEHGAPVGRYRAPARWSNGAGSKAGPSPIPGLRGLDHIGYAVADLDTALAVFAGVLGGEVLSRDTDVAVLRMGPTDNVELSSFTRNGPNARPPRNCDIGGRHLALHVEDVDAAVAHLAARPGFLVLGKPETIVDGPIAGDRWVYVRSPIGLHIEVVRMPDGDLPYERSTAARRRAAGTLRWSDR